MEVAATVAAGADWVAEATVVAGMEEAEAAGAVMAKRVMAVEGTAGAAVPAGEAAWEATIASAHRMAH